MRKVQIGAQIAARVSGFYLSSWRPVRGGTLRFWLSFADRGCQDAERQERVKEMRGDAVEEENVHGFFKEFTGKMTGASTPTHPQPALGSQSHPLSLLD